MGIKCHSQQCACFILMRTEWRGEKETIGFVHVACSNMLQYALIIAPIHSNVFIRVSMNYDRSMLEHATRINLTCCDEPYIIIYYILFKTGLKGYVMQFATLSF